MNPDIYIYKNFYHLIGMKIKKSTGMSAYVMTFEERAVREDEKWQAPVYCFDKGTEYSTSEVKLVDGVLRASISYLLSSLFGFYF